MILCLATVKDLGNDADIAVIHIIIGLVFQLQHLVPFSENRIARLDFLSKERWRIELLLQRIV